MRIMFALLMAATAFAAPGYLTSMELSHDDGTIDTWSWCYLHGDDAYTGDEFDVPTGGP